MAASACGKGSNGPDSKIVSVEVAPPTATLAVGETVQLMATLRDGAGRAQNRPGVVWSTSNSDVAIVSTGGLVAGVGGGQVSITASYQGKSGQATITVSAPCQVVGLSVDPFEFTVDMGASYTLTATVAQANCDQVPVSWNSEDPGVATVDDTGVVTGIWPGTTIITATADTIVRTSFATVRPALPVGHIFFSHLPTDLDRVVGFFGIGDPYVHPKDHGAFLAPPQENTIPVHAMADGWIEGLIYNSFPGSGLDLTMRIRYSTTIWSNYAHLSDFAEEIWDAAGPLNDGAETRVDIPVQAGQIVAWAGLAGGFDFYVGDDALEHPFISPSRYNYPTLKGAYPFDFFQEPLLSQVLAITLRLDEPRGGKMVYDLPGKIIGNWFLEGGTGTTRLEQLGEHLAIVYDFIDGTKIAVADGWPLRQGAEGAHVYWVEGNAPPPEAIGQGDGLVKYEIRQRWFKDALYSGHVTSEVLGTFLVEMFEPGKIRVETVLGKRAHEVVGFTDAARIYVR
jgi:hypothetical protein